MFSIKILINKRVRFVARKIQRIFQSLHLFSIICSYFLCRSTTSFRNFLTNILWAISQATKILFTNRYSLLLPNSLFLFSRISHLNFATFLQCSSKSLMNQMDLLALLTHLICPSKESTTSQSSNYLFIDSSSIPTWDKFQFQLKRRKKKNTLKLLISSSDCFIILPKMKKIRIRFFSNLILLFKIAFKR